MLNFREANLNDIIRLRELEQGVIAYERPFNNAIKTEPTTYYDLEHLIQDEDSYLVVAETSGVIIGTGYGQKRPSKSCFNHSHHAYLGFMFVSPEFRGQGINKSIIDRLIAWSKSHGIKDIYLDVYYDNPSAISAYKKVGFEPNLIEMKLKVD